MAVLSVFFGLLSFGMVLLYMTYNPFRFLVRMGFYYISLFVLCFMILPVLIYNGRCAKNLKIIARVFEASRVLYGIDGEVREYENMIQDNPCVIVSNHQCSLDLFGMSRLYPKRPSFMGKHSLLYLGPVGLSLWLCGGIFVNRANHKTTNEMIERISEEVSQRNLQLWIFPEGTRNFGRGMLPFKKGAFNIAVTAQIPIVPVVFKCYEEFFSKKEYRFEPGKYVAEVLPPVSTEGLTLDDVQNLADRVRERMLNAYNRLSGFDG